VAVTPGVDAAGAAPMPRAGLQMLSAGISESGAGISPNCQTWRPELRQVQALFHGPTLLNQEFVLPVLQRDFGQNTIPGGGISRRHGQFGHNTRQSFLLTHNGKLTLDNWRRCCVRARRGQAGGVAGAERLPDRRGDDRAALGLAGVAVKAGARSALATLWFVQDESTGNTGDRVLRRIAARRGGEQGQRLATSANQTVA